MGLGFDPATQAHDAALIFVGRIGSPWRERADCPKNMNAARASRLGATVEIAAPFRPGLRGLAGYSHIAILTWLDRSPRHLIVQSPRHSDTPRGVFSLRSPLRPNPVGLHVVRVVKLDIEAGRIEIDAIDVLDATPVIDVKPYLPSIDAFPDAAIPGDRRR